MRGVSENRVFLDYAIVFSVVGRPDVQSLTQDRRRRARAVALYAVCAQPTALPPLRSQLRAVPVLAVLASHTGLEFVPSWAGTPRMAAGNNVNCRNLRSSSLHSRNQHRGGLMKYQSGTDMNLCGELERVRVGDTRPPISPVAPGWMYLYTPNAEIHTLHRNRPVPYASTLPLCSLDRSFTTAPNAMSGFTSRLPGRCTC